MVISNSRQYIFFHIPKCGGTTMSRVLAHDVRWNDIVIGGTPTGEALHGPWRKQFGAGKHAMPPEVRRVVGEDIYQRYFKFVVVRDPIDRFISACQFVKYHIDAASPWILQGIDPDATCEIRAARRVSDLARSAFVNAVFTRTGLERRHSLDDVARYFAPQHLYVDTQETQCGRFVCYRIDAMNDALHDLRARGLVDRVRTEEIPAQNKSIPTLEVDIDRRLREQLEGWYRDDYKLLLDRSPTGELP
jgi:hypothetical protein